MMCNLVLKPLIKRFKQQEMEVFPQIYKIFERLINLYATRLFCEDSISDLTLFLIELLYNIDLSRFNNDETYDIKKYIAVCLRNKYINLSMQKSTLSNKTLPLMEDIIISENNFENKIVVSEILKFLNDKQKAVLVYKYIYGYGDCEIAIAMGISRQAVNRLKNRALQSLKELLV